MLERPRHLLAEVDLENQLQFHCYYVFTIQLLVSNTKIRCLENNFVSNAGRILWDGEDLRNFSRKSLHHRVAVVPQDIMIFNRSIRENIAYGDPDMPLSTVIEAAKKAHIHDFIMSKYYHYFTNLTHFCF